MIISETFSCRVCEGSKIHKQEQCSIDILSIGHENKSASLEDFMKGNNKICGIWIFHHSVSGEEQLFA